MKAKTLSSQHENYTQPTAIGEHFTIMLQNYSAFREQHDRAREELCVFKQCVCDNTPLHRY